MKRTAYFFVFAFFVSLPSFSIGLTLGPFSNERYLVENNQFSLDYYDFPLFYGGLYHKVKFSEKIFYYVDLAFDIHNSRIAYTDTVSGNDMNNYLLYLHTDFNFFPFNQKWVYAGTGIELIVIDRVFSGEAVQRARSNFYVTTDYFCYIDAGINIPIGILEIGFKTLYRLLPFSLNGRIGNGEISLLIGLK
jgi:hypothetical protein